MMLLVSRLYIVDDRMIMNMERLVDSLVLLRKHVVCRGQHNFCAMFQLVNYIEIFLLL
jgi:hypothetical protein